VVREQHCGRRQRGRLLLRDPGPDDLPRSGRAYRFMHLPAVSHAAGRPSCERCGVGHDGYCGRPMPVAERLARAGRGQHRCRSAVRRRWRFPSEAVVGSARGGNARTGYGRVRSGGGLRRRRARGLDVSDAGDADRRRTGNHPLRVQCQRTERSLEPGAFCGYPDLADRPEERAVVHGLRSRQELRRRLAGSAQCVKDLDCGHHIPAACAQRDSCRQ